MKGKVKWFSNDKGYGFISAENNKDIFVHFSAIVSDKYKTLKESDSVEFDLVSGPKGDQASNVRLV